MILTLNDITNVCQQVVDTSIFYTTNMNSIMQLMYNIGCRESETTDRSLWTKIDPTKFELQPNKNNNIRTIQSSYIPLNYQNWLDNTGYPYQLYSKRRIQMAFDQFSPYMNLYVGNKEVSSHLFRYRYIKQLKADGFSDSEILNFTGLKVIATAYRYINADVYT